MEKRESGNSPQEMRCTSANAQAFNAALRRHMPEVFAQAKSLHQLGLLDGLRGASLRFFTQSQGVGRGNPENPQGKES